MKSFVAVAFFALLAAASAGIIPSAPVVAHSAYAAPGVVAHAAPFVSNASPFVAHGAPIAYAGNPYAHAAPLAYGASPLAYGAASHGVYY